MIFLALVAAAALDLVPQVGHTVAAVDIATSPDGKVLVSAGANDGLRIWDPEHQRLVRSLPSELSGNILFVANDRLVSWAARASGGCNLDVLSLSKGEVVRVLRSDPSVMGCGAHELSASADGAIVAEGTWNGKAFVFDVTTGAELRRLESAEVGMGLSSLSPDGQKLAFAIYDKTEIQVVDVKSGGSAGALKSMGVRALGFTQSGVLVLEDKAIRTLDAGTGAELSKIVLEPGFKSGNFSRDGSLAAVSDSTAVRVFDLQTGQQVWSATQTELELQSSPSLVKTLMDVARGRAVLLPFLGDNSSMKLLDLKTGHVIGKFAGRVMAPLSSQLQPTAGTS
jgi:WD40 repeat protein